MTSLYVLFAMCMVNATVWQADGRDGRMAIWQVAALGILLIIVWRTARERSERG